MNRKSRLALILRSILISITALTSLIFVSGCGGGSTSPPATNASAPISTPASDTASWLEFTPQSINSFVVPVEYPTPMFAISAKSSKTLPQEVQLGVIDAKGVSVAGQTKITKNSSVSYTALLPINLNLPAGVHTGEFEVRVCYDNPIICSRPVEGSPWKIPYRLELGDKNAIEYTGFSTAGLGGFLDDFALSQIGSTLVVVSAGRYGQSMETWTSIDAGGSWKMLNVPGPSRLSKNFSLANDSKAVYLSGGSSIPSNSVTSTAPTLYNHVWKFDGITWIQKTAMADFPARENHLMTKLGQDLYIISGFNKPAIATIGVKAWDDGKLSDIWKSSDDGVIWTKIGDGISAIAKSVCLVAWNESLVILTPDAVWTSQDGANWVRRPGSIPKMEVDARCAVMNGRLYVVGWSRSLSNTGSFSTSDLDNWRPEAQPFNYDNGSPGLAVINDKANNYLVFVIGEATSQRQIFRSTPRLVTKP